MADGDATSYNARTKEPRGARPPPKKAALAIQLRFLHLGQDLQRLVELENGEPAHAWNGGEFVRILRPQNRIGIVAEHDGTIVGFMVFEFFKAEGTARLVKICVDPQCRRAGVGRQMLEWLVEKELGHRRSELDLGVDERNVGAQRFFQACGFRATEVERNGRNDCEYRMRLNYRTGREQGPRR